MSAHCTRYCLSCGERVVPEQFLTAWSDERFNPSLACPFCFEDTISDDELASRGEAQDEARIEAFYGSSTPQTLDEQHAAAWLQKQELRR